MTTSPLAVHDVVALLIDLDAHGLVRGQVGTVVERLTDDHFEIEFSDDLGRTYAQLAVHRDSVLVLHHRLARPDSATSASSEFIGSETQSATDQDSMVRDGAGLDAVFGKWPGEETDEELAAALAGSK